MHNAITVKHRPELLKGTLVNVRKRQDRQPTCVSQVEQAMIQANDFVNLRGLMAAAKLTSNQVSASLSHLHKYRAADCLESPDGLWWFLTPDTDTRTKKVEERRPEDKPRRTRRSIGKKVE